MDATNLPPKWGTARVEITLCKSIDKAVKTIKNGYGLRKYRSRSDFVKEACMKQLEIENNNLQKELLQKEVLN